MTDAGERIEALRARARRYREMALAADRRTADILLGEARDADREADRLTNASGG